MSEEKDRIKKLNEIKKEKVNPYPSWSKRTFTCREAAEKFDLGKGATLVGRLVSIRLHGRACFAHLEDNSGRFQIFLNEGDLGRENYRFFTKQIDVGDFLQVEGELFETKIKEKTLKVLSWEILSKAIFPLPEKWHGLSDVETRFRQRYLDILANKEVKKVFLKRSEIISAIREFFNQRDFVEVETPVLQPLSGGAAARPFVTHHQALDIDLYLRIAPELYLKRLIVGGFERVYEIARCFRNEGIDWAHNPEFTQIEFYQAYADYQDLMKLTEDLFKVLLKKVTSGSIVKYQGKEIDLTPPYPRIDYREAMLNHTGIDIDKEKNLSELTKKAEKLKIPVERTWGRGKIIDEIYKEKVRPKIVNPVFLINHPLEVSPLAKRIPDRPNYTERFQLLVAGLEIGNAFSELNDPFDQEERFEEQQKLLDKGDQEAQPFDQDFINALKYGMPPTAGEGIGLDRLVCLLTNTRNIKEVILFPTMRPRPEEH